MHTNCALERTVLIKEVIWDDGGRKERAIPGTRGRPTLRETAPASGAAHPFKRGFLQNRYLKEIPHTPFCGRLETRTLSQGTCTLLAFGTSPGSLSDRGFISFDAKPHSQFALLPYTRSSAYSLALPAILRDRTLWYHWTRGETGFTSGCTRYPFRYRAVSGSERRAVDRTLHPRMR